MALGLTLRLKYSAVVPFLLLLVSCGDVTIDPFKNEGRIYTVYGYLNERSLSHEIRVVPITRRIEHITSPQSPQAQIDAFVTTTDLSTESTRSWSHSLEQLSDGTFGHVFRAEMRVLPDHRYRLEVKRSDGRSATAETRVPFLSNTVVEASSPFVRDDSVYQEIRLVGVRSPWDINIKYYFNPAVLLEYGRVGYRDGDDWVIELNIDRQVDRLARLLSIPRGAVVFEAMGVLATAMDDDWVPPGDVFDRDVLAQPGTLSNITNGYGFFGSTGLLQFDWQISDELRVALGF